MKYALPLLLAVIAMPAVAQEIPIAPAGADGRFQTQLDKRMRVDGAAAAQTTGFHLPLTVLTDRLLAMPEINQPAAPQCMRVSSFIETALVDGLMAASVDVHRPIIIDGKCSKLTGSTVQIWLNSTYHLFPSRLKQDQGPDGQDWFVLPIQSQTPDRLVLIDDGEEIEVFTHGRRPLLRRIAWDDYQTLKAAGTKADDYDASFSAADYDKWRRTEFSQIAANARKQIAEATQTVTDAKLKSEMRAAVEDALAAQDEMMRSRISSSPALNGSTADEASGSPGDMACLIEYEVVPQAECSVSQQLVALNPDYFDARQPQRVQLILMRTAQKPEHGENAAAYEGRRRIWDALDRAELQKIMQQ